jgi:hypothetical protein
MAIRSTSYSPFQAAHPSESHPCESIPDKILSTVSARLVKTTMSTLNPALSANQFELHQSKMALLKDKSAHLVRFRTPHDTEIEGVFFPAKGSKKAILFALSEGATFEKIADSTHPDARIFKLLRKEFGDSTSILIVNYGEIGLSEGTASLDHWAMDLYSAYAFLQHNGHNNVLLYGRSLGAHLSLKACSHIYDKYQVAPPVISDRGFDHPRDWVYPSSTPSIFGKLKLACHGLSSPVDRLCRHDILQIDTSSKPEPISVDTTETEAPLTPKKSIVDFVKKSLNV